MAGESTTYSFADCTATISHPLVGQLVLHGKGLGSITVTPATDKTNHDVGADGSVMISKVAGDNAQLDIEVQQSSSAAKWLANYYNYVLIAPAEAWAQALITIKDPSGFTTIATDVSPQKRADKGYNESGQRVTWPFMSANCSEVPL